MDLEILYNMAKATTQSAERMSQTNVGGYYAFVREYNKLVPLVHDLFGTESKSLFQRILIKDLEPRKVSPMRWGEMAELAVSRLTSLTAYLQAKRVAPNRQVHAVLDLVTEVLRPSIFSKPKQEKDIQNTLEVIFRSRGLDYRREKVRIEYSSKSFVPDFTFESLDLAVEVKFCDSEKKEKTLIDEMNADIPAYQTRYRWIIFVVYDLGIIQDVHLFKASIESNPDVYVHVQKH